MSWSTVESVGLIFDLTSIQPHCSCTSKMPTIKVFLIKISMFLNYISELNGKCVTHMLCFVYITLTIRILTDLNTHFIELVYFCSLS